MMRRNQRHRAFDPDPAAPARSCDIPGCPEAAGYRAPRSRQALNDYYWFCLEHVREYNSRWDFYKGMNPGQIEAHLRADQSWNRPSWRLGHLGGAASFEEDRILDPLGLLRGTADPRVKRQRDAAGRTAGSPEQLREPLETLGLAWPVSLDEVKSRYKQLARRHHPDANNGDREAEEKLKSINVAYSALKRHLGEARRADLARSA